MSHLTRWYSFERNQTMNPRKLRIPEEKENELIVRKREKRRHPLDLGSSTGNGTGGMCVFGLWVFELEV